MSNKTSHTLKHNEIAAVMGNMMKLVFFDNSRVNAKRTYQDALAGKLLRLPSVSMEDKSQIDLKLTLNADEFVGTLSFSYFKKHLGLLLSRIAEVLDQGEIEILTAEDGKQHILKVPVAYVQNNDVNIMALGFDLEPGQMHIKLMFLASEQFKDMGEGDVA